MKISNVSIVGLGALGVMFGNFLLKKLPEGSLRVIADEKRISKYKSNNIYCNDEKCDFTYVNPNEITDIKSDLIIFAVKFSALKDAIKLVENQVHKDTIFISLLNGISSEEIISSKYKKENIILCTAQGMDALKNGNRVYYKNMGFLKIGTYDNLNKDKLGDLSNFFDKINFPYKVESNMRRALWSKLLLNTGINQSCMVFNTNFGGVQIEGKSRDIMISAMKEVVLVANFENIELNEDDIKLWLDLVSTLNPKGKPSMLQDFEARRYSEVELFSGEIIKLAKKHNLSTPTNDFLYKKIKSIESTY